MKIKSFIFFLFAYQQILFSQSTLNCYPTNWWVGMKNPKLQIIVHAKEIGNATGFTINYPGVKIDKVNRVENKNYVFLDLHISQTAKPGKFTIQVSGASTKSIPYELKKKESGDGTTRIRGVNASDFIYLMMPDRFANGDPSNDAFPDMKTTVADRNNPFARHGGDLKGVQDHLNYFSDLGVTTIWLCPVVENDMPLTDEGGAVRSTYHGYAFTDQYHVDRRFGGNEAYLKLANAIHDRGMKLIQDAVYNHVGIAHWSIEDMPMKDWVHQWPSYTNTSYKDQPLVDPYASELDKKISLDGWFTRFMPDLNQQNPYVSNFLIQYAIWATETFGVDGWRVDTYFYNDPNFLNQMNLALIREFPALTVFGETLVSLPLNAAYFCENNLNVPFKHNLQGVTDHPLHGALNQGLKEKIGWSEGFSRIYSILAQDILYKNPMRNCIYLDNHDLDRFYSVMEEDFSRYKMGITLLLTLRGIPELYYGTEILMKNMRSPSDAEVRRDFPGGWPGDSSNKFVASGRTAKENEAFNYVKALAQFRKSSTAIGQGKTLQYVPLNGVWVYFRSSKSQTVMVILNSADEEKKIQADHFAEGLKGFTRGRDVISNNTIDLNNLSVAPHSSLVLELLK